MALLLLGTVLWAGCSGGEQGVTDLTPADGSTASAAASTVAPLPTDPPVTTAVTPSTTGAAPSTIEPPTPETSTAPDEADAVVAAYLAAWQAFHEAAMSPADLALRAEVEATRTGPSLERALATLDELLQSNWVAVDNPDHPARSTIEAVLGVVGDSATVIVCNLNSTVIIEPGAAPDGSDALVNDDIVSLRLEVTLEQADGEWKVSGGRTLGEWPGATECG